MQMNYEIRIEDYVITFLRQLANREESYSQALLLVGEKVCDCDMYTYIVYGAVEVGEQHLEEGRVLFEEDERAYLMESCKKNFPNQEILGFAILESGFNRLSFDTIWKEMGGDFSKEDKILLHLHKEEKWEMAYVNCNDYVMPTDGFEIFYEDNTPMQQYLIYWNQLHCNREQEQEIDLVTRRCRTFLREQKTEIVQRREYTYLSIICMLLLIVLSCVGISMMNNYEKLKEVECAMIQLSEMIQEQQPQRELEYVLPEANLIELEQTIEAVVEESKIHEVVAGDTLREICRFYYDNEEQIEAICEKNEIVDPNQIQIGQKILLP